MTEPEEERRLLALQRHIQAAGGTVARLRGSLRRAFWVVTTALLTCLGMVLAWEYFRIGVVPLLPVALAIFLIASVLLLVAFPFLFPVPALYRRQLRRQLGRQMSGLPHEPLAQALRSLQQQGGDTGKIVEPLLRELRSPSEVTPATPPAGRGDEASPAD
jgi:hypothetical protein